MVNKLPTWRESQATAAFNVFLPIAFAVMAAWIGYKSAWFVLNGEKAEATCTRVETRSGVRTGGGSSFYSVHHVQFTDADGATRQTTVDGFLAGLSEGEAVEVLYDSRDPTQAAINHHLSLWLIPGFFGSMALAGMAPMIRKHLRKRRSVPLAHDS